MAEAYSDEVVEVAATKLRLLRGGQGEPLLVLHGAGGNRGWLQYLQTLAQHFQVYVPDHPGFGKSDQPEWVASVPDLACFYLWALEDLGLSRVRVLGFSLGGWLAAEMAAKMFYDSKQAPEYDQLYGQPPTPEEQDVLNRNREMAARITWKPYMHDPRLPSLLRRLRMPTLIVWGRQDALVPVNCGELFQQNIRGSRLVIMEQCGHVPQLERPQEFVNIVSEFL
jgi:pimeloyl-ACP methyl ester carboxylesterase